MSHPIPEHSLTAFNAASSRKTPGVTPVIALTGLPVVLAYSVSIDWIFRGKGKPDKMGG
jgi:cytochrome d ubiquinol oxidase subunit II